MKDCTFNADKHEYRINGRRVPGVTQVLSDLIPGYRASDWYLQRGRAVHAAAAFVARGIAFEHDPRIAGQVEAVRRFYREIDPIVQFTELPVYSERYQYAGTLDLIYMIKNGRSLILDFKASLTPSTIYQCAAYALAAPVKIRYGVGVELHADGTYKMSEVWDLKRPTQEWLSLLTTFRIRERLGCLNKEEEDHE